MILHDFQRKIVVSKARFKVIRAGRKGGKTAMEVENISYIATAKAEDLNISKTSFSTGRKVLYIAPTQKQARIIVWEALKKKLGKIGKANEQLLELKVPNKDSVKGDPQYTTIYVGGWENRENYRGLTDVVHITFDEVDTLRDFFVAWLQIFRPMFLDTSGTANFIGTPKKDNPNLKRLEKEFAGKGDNFESFKFTSQDNPHLPIEELEELKSDYVGDMSSYKQEILAEYVADEGALFRYSALIDLFSNTIDKEKEKFLIVDIADDGSDRTIFSFWEGLELYRINIFKSLQTEGIINQMREYASQDRIPYSNMAVDAIGVGAGVASSSLLQGVIGYKSSYGAIRTDHSAVHLPNVHYTKYAPLSTEYLNLRCQCLFVLSYLVNDHKISVKTEDSQIKSEIIEELSNYQDITQGDAKRKVTGKEDVKANIGRSPDITDTMIMRMYFVIKGRMLPYQSENEARADDIIKANMDEVAENLEHNSSK